MGDRWVEAYLRTKWHLDPSSRLTKTDMGRKMGAVPLWGRALSQSNTKRPGQTEVYRPTKWHLDPSNRLATIHQRHRETDRQDRTDNGLIA